MVSYAPIFLCLCPRRCLCGGGCLCLSATEWWKKCTLGVVGDGRRRQVESTVKPSKWFAVLKLIGSLYCLRDIIFLAHWDTLRCLKERNPSRHTSIIQVQ
ncbi:hypothetical protein L873DRAFT_1796771 [Choiromyces venosus 120613-1]|uniref:Secreted protein n=1 Tax=Choiromyces venosus 120613-1 TaxID=1336337 RepID=A0A3N4K5T6_9PEZI|nr:hypothetical protein L873DRAFT_1796771 [Choiromyces venosus 120613-1]